MNCVFALTERFGCWVLRQACPSFISFPTTSLRFMIGFWMSLLVVPPALQLSGTALDHCTTGYVWKAASYSLVAFIHTLTTLKQREDIQVP